MSLLIIKGAYCNEKANIALLKACSKGIGVVKYLLSLWSLALIQR